MLFQLDFTCSNFFAMYYANKNLITLAHYISKLFNTTSNLFETKHDVLIKTYYQFIKYKLNKKNLYSILACSKKLAIPF